MLFLAEREGWKPIYLNIAYLLTINPISITYKTEYAIAFCIILDIFGRFLVD